MIEQGLREKLNNIRRKHRALEHELERRDYLEAKATSVPAIRTDRDKVKTTPQNKQTAIIDALADLETEIEARAKELEKLKSSAKKIFDSTDLSQQEREVMRLRYIDCLNWYDIADVMYWSRRQVQRWHGSALEKIGTRWHTKAHAGT